MKQSRRLEITAFRRRTTIVLRDKVGRVFSESLPFQVQKPDQQEQTSLACCRKTRTASIHQLLAKQDRRDDDERQN
jgi:hypothetical protein